MTNISVIWDAVTVHKAIFVQISHNGPHGNYPDPTEFFVNHYDTTILRGYYSSEDNEPTIMKMLLEGRTQSDDKAISQALDYLKIDKTPKQVEKEVKEYQRRLR